MHEEMNDRLQKQLESILREKGFFEPELPPCKYYRLVPPPGCILGWDICQCNFCSFYKPVDMPPGRPDDLTGDR